MKKILCILLTICMLYALVPAAFAADDDGVMNIAVSSDTHIGLPSAPPAGDTMFSYASGTGSMTRESTAILDSFLNSAQENKVEYVLIAGDITDTGSYESFSYVAGLLSDFEDRTGIPVYVINGNHDISFYGESALADFKSIFARFGYDDANAVDRYSCSYTVDLSDSYRLLAIDSCAIGDHGDGIDTARLAWIEEQVNAANRDNVKLIAMQHHNVLEHYGMQSTLSKDFIVKDYKTIAAKYADWGIKYVFTGHVHMHDIASFTSNRGNELYDILTTSLSCYPLKYRTVSFSDAAVSVKTVILNSIDTSLLAEGYSDEQLALLGSDVNAYAKGYFEYAISKVILRYINAQQLKNLMGDRFSSDSSIFTVIDAAMPKIYEALTMPLYSDGDDNSLSAIGAQYDIIIPQSNFATLFDALLFFVNALTCGDEYYPVYTTETQILLKGVSAGLNYALDGIDTKVAAKAIQEGIAYLGYDLPEQLSTLGSGLVTNKTLIDVVVSKVLTPVVEQVTVDASPLDNDTRLPGYAVRGITPESFFQKFLAFIRRVLTGVLDLFYILFG